MSRWNHRSIFLQKLYCQWQPLSRHDNRLFDPWNWSSWFRRHLVSTRWESHQSMDLFREHFGEQIISPYGPVHWSPRSCGITPLDFFLRGYVKSKVYADNAASPWGKTSRVSFASYQSKCSRVIENLTQRMDHLRRSRGQDMKEISSKNKCQITFFRMIINIPN